MRDIDAARAVHGWMVDHKASTLHVDDENTTPSYARSYVDSDGVGHELDDADLNDHVAWLPGAVVTNPTEPAWNPVVTLAHLQDWIAENEVVEFWTVFPDIQNSYALAMRHAGVKPDTITEITTTVTDYAANHYGDN